MTGTTCYRPKGRPDCGPLCNERNHADEDNVSNEETIRKWIETENILGSERWINTTTLEEVLKQLSKACAVNADVKPTVQEQLILAFNEPTKKRKEAIQAVLNELQSQATGEIEIADNWPLVRPTDDWLDERPAARRALVTLDGKPYILRGKVGLLVASGGHGKSQLLMQLAVSVASGKKWLPKLSFIGDGFQIPEAGAVCLAFGEEDEAEVRRRLFWTAKHLQLDEDQQRRLKENLVVVPLCGKSVALLGQRPGDRRNEQSETFRAIRLKEQLSEWVTECDGWALVCLDPASRFGGLQMEVDNAVATRFVEVLESLTELKGNPAVICSHHTSKGAMRAKESDKDQGSARGASALVDGARWVAELFRNGEGGQKLRVTKNNYGRSGTDTDLDLFWQQAAEDSEVWVLVNNMPERVL